MKRFLVLSIKLAVLAVLASQASGQSVSDAERDLLLNHLEKSRATLEQATRDLSPAQWNFKSNVFRWSVAECLEHIALTEDFLFGLVTERVMKAPQTSERDPGEVANADQSLLKNAANRSARFQAPEPLQPKKRTATPQELLARFTASRNRTIDFARTERGLRTHCIDSAFGKCTDAYQWLLLISAHSERHTTQLLEVKADPNFPKQ